MLILLHEQLQREANYLKAVIEKVYEIPVRVLERDLEPFLYQITKDCYSHDPNLNGEIGKQYQDKAVLLLTRRDIFALGKMFSQFSEADQWVFAGTSKGCPYHLVSTARLKGEGTDEKQYFRRLELLAIHELGHTIVSNQDHYQEAYWVNATNGHRVPLGTHCIYSTCVMYESIDVSKPRPDQEYLFLDRERYDAGLDEHLARVNVDCWFCGKCSDKLHANIPPEYL